MSEQTQQTADYDVPEVVRVGDRLGQVVWVRNAHDSRAEVYLVVAEGAGSGDRWTGRALLSAEQATLVRDALTAWIEAVERRG